MSENLTRLVGDTSLREIGKRAGVDHKTVGSMCEGERGTSIDQVDAVASAFNLAGWQLLRPTLDVENAPTRAEVDRLIELFYATPPHRRQAILTTIDPTDHPTSAKEGNEPGENKATTKTPRARAY
jgi:hypothetical protein